MQFIGTFWAMVPPIVTIIMGLATKKVNLSLITGLLLGVLLYCGFAPGSSLVTMVSVINESVSSHIGHLLFAVLLGMFVYLITQSGASQSYGEWAVRKLKTKKSSLLATAGLGILIFVDDYFNCLTVGTVMRPLTDRHKISREKLAYIIDTTAAPVCILAPISSWAAGVSSSLPPGSDIDGFNLFLRTMPMNYYALFSIFMVFLIIIMNFDFGLMKHFEKETMLHPRIEDIAVGKTDDKGTGADPSKAPGNAGSFNASGAGSSSSKVTEGRGRARVFDLLLPVIFLVAACVFFMAYTGGFFTGEVGLVDAFANCDAVAACCIGTFLADLFMLFLYVPRKIYTFNQYMDGLEQGFRNMVPAMLLLSLAWSLGNICGESYLDAGSFIAGIVDRFNVPLESMPMFFFIAAIILAFATGTSWGTFVILIPMEISVFAGADTALMVMTTAAVLGGSVCGDHLSPISDTTILSSAGAQCDHLNHVQTQVIYGALVAAISFLCYILAGVTQNSVLGLIAGTILLVAVLSGLKLRDMRMEKAKE